MERDLTDLERKLLDIANELASARKTITIERLYQDAKRKLSESNDELSIGIYNLLLKKYIVIGSKLTKERALLNEKRYKMYNYILEHPGCHLSELKRFISLKGQLAKWHLTILEKFDYIYSTKYLKYLTFFPRDFKKGLVNPYLAIKGPNASKIISSLWKNPAPSLGELQSHSSLELATLKHHLTKLLDADVLFSHEVNEEAYYILNQEILRSLQPYLSIQLDGFEEYFHHQNEVLEQKKRELPTISGTDGSKPVAAPSAEDSADTIAEVAEDQKEGISLEQVKLLREYDYIGGGIRFKIAVQNIAKTALMDFNVTLVPTSQYEIDQRVKMINNLKPGESRGVDFQLIPLTCGKSKVYGSVSYIDAFGEPHTVTVRPKEIWIKCPLVVPKQKTSSEIEELKTHLLRGAANITFSSLPREEIFYLARDQISALDLSEVKTDNQALILVYAGVAKVTGNDMVIEARIGEKILSLEVWTNDMKQATGFLAYIKNMIDVAIKAAEKLKGKVDKISQKIVDASDIILKLERLCLDCEKNWIISDILLSLTESLNKIERSFPDIIVSEQIQNSFERLEDTFREGDSIDTRSGIDLEYKAISWIKALNTIAQNNLKTYIETFPEEAEKIHQLQLLETNIAEKIAQLEHSYAKSVLVYLMVISKDSGMCLTEIGTEDADVEPDLVSGFLSAIQSFGMELSKEDVPMKKIAYKNLEIELYAGQATICALLARGETTAHLRSLLQQFSSIFESQFSDVLQDWNGDVTLFKDAKDLFEKVFS
jgi:predicted transcriptional regulator